MEYSSGFSYNAVGRTAGADSTPYFKAWPIWNPLLPLPCLDGPDVVRDHHNCCLQGNPLHVLWAMLSQRPYPLTPINIKDAGIQPSAMAGTKTHHTHPSANSRSSRSVASASWHWYLLMFHCGSLFSESSVTFRARAVKDPSLSLWTA